MRRRLISVLLTVAIVVGCMTGLPLYADGPDYAAINIAAGEKKTITVTSSEDWVYYSFTPD